MNSIITDKNKSDNPSEFDIRNYLGLLGNRTKEGKYTCPNCGGHNLSINKNDGKYDCYNCGDTKAIFKAIKQKAGEWEDKWEKSHRQKQTRYYHYPNRNDGLFIRVQRTDCGNGKKKFYQQQWVASRNEYVNGLSENKKKPGTVTINREDIPIYRCREVQSAIADGKKIFIAEGESAVDALWDLGIPATCNIGGSGQWKGSDSQDLKGAKVVICPDRDIKGINHAELIAKDFPNAEWLYAYPQSGLWDRLNSGGGADVADWIEEYNLSAENILNAVESKQRELKPSPVKQDSNDNAGNNEPSVKFKPKNIRWDKSCNKWKIIGAGSPAANERFLREELKIHERLRLNLLTMEYEIDGKSVSEMYPNGVGYDLPTFIDEHFHFYFTGALDKFYPLIERVAAKFHPVRDYLKGLPTQDSDFIDDFIKRSLKITKPIQVLMVRKWLIGAARRILSDNPVKFDNALILQGRQGIGKSTFFEALARAGFFTDDMGSISDKDEKIKPHYAWIVEWSELENIFDKSKESAIKAYLTSKTDNIRPPYARSSKKMNRGFSICGTTNKNEFLTDKTGNRRFWVIPLTHKKGEQIDIDYVKQNRDKLWGAVMAAIANNEPHWLDQENSALAELEASKSVWRNPDVQDVLIPAFYKKLTEGTNKISRQEINDILDGASKTQTAAQLDKFMATYELTKGARNIAYRKLGEDKLKKDYRGFYLTDDDGQIPPKLLQAFEEFGLGHPLESVSSQSPNLVTNPETPTTTESSQSVTETTPVTADDIFKPEEKAEVTKDEKFTPSKNKFVPSSEVGNNVNHKHWIKPNARLIFKSNKGFIGCKFITRSSSGFVVVETGKDEESMVSFDDLFWFKQRDIPG
ncbi:VapE domain-containing protein [Dapis sp. BLCC M172]|uniref:VapE domain-containing protein n=1 Tax=Dapis sp. BLCC M172 TaxID=2975281 RepID=UPI003CF2F92C